MKTTTITLAAARKKVAKAYAALNSAKPIVRFPGSLGQNVYNLEAGMMASRERSYVQARAVLETMVRLNVTRLEKLVLRGSDMVDPGYSTIYFNDRTEEVLTLHSSHLQVELGETRARELRFFLLSRGIVR